MEWFARKDCPKCGGAGWLWWHELAEYDTPHGVVNDDTKYGCDHECHQVDTPEGRDWERQQAVASLTQQRTKLRSDVRVAVERLTAVERDLRKYSQ